MKKRTLFITTLVLAVALYSVAWVYVSSYIKKVLKQEEELIGKELLGDEIILSGYPFNMKFTIKGENRQHPILRRIDAVSFNLFSRKIALHIKNDPSAKPIILPNLEDLEFSMKPNTDAMYYFKLNSYSMVVNYIRNKETNLDWIDLFNLSHETGLAGEASMYDKKASSTKNASVLFSANLPGKKIYKDFEELYLDIPHHLTANLEYNVDHVSYDESNNVASAIKKINLLMYPDSGKVDISFNLPEQVFETTAIGNIIKNIELKIKGQSKSGIDSCKYNVSVTNAEGLVHIHGESYVLYNKEGVELLNRLSHNKEDLFELIKYTIVMLSGEVTNNAEQKLRLAVDKLSTISSQQQIKPDNEVKYSLDVAIPHAPNSGKKANYTLYIGDSLKMFNTELKGEISSINISHPFIGFPVIDGVLSITDKTNLIATMVELKDLYILAMMEEAPIDIFKQRIDKFEKNITLWSNTFRALSDEPKSASEGMQYTYNVDFQAPDLMKSKISKTNALEEALKLWDALALELGVLPQEEAK